MSVHAISAALRLATPPTPKLVLIVLANYADQDGNCWPSLKRLRAETGLSQRSVQNGIDWLIAHNVLQKTERRRKDGTQASNSYRLTYQVARVATCWAPPRQVATAAPYLARVATHEPSGEPPLKRSPRKERTYKEEPIGPTAKIVRLGERQ